MLIRIAMHANVTTAENPLRTNTGVKNAGERFAALASEKKPDGVLMPKYNPDSRRSMIIKIQIAKKQLGMEDEDYRAALDEFYGKSSCTKLSLKELADFIKHLEGCGAVFTSKGKKSPTPSPDFYEIPEGTPYAEQKRWIAVLWNALGWKMSGIDARCKKQFRVDKFVWVNDQMQLQTLAKDLIGRCHKRGINPDDVQPAN